MPRLISLPLVATLAVGLGACGGTSSMGVGFGPGGGGVSTGMSATTTISAPAASPVSAVTENQLRAEWSSQALADRTRLTGSVYNGWVMWARDILVLVDSL